MKLTTWGLLRELRTLALNIEEDAGRTYGGLPYTVHLDAVALVLHDLGYHSTDYQALAYVHDVLEDAKNVPTQREAQRNIELLLGKVEGVNTSGVMAALNALTVRSTTNTTRPRVDYLEKVLAHPIASVVKVADRIANVEALLHPAPRAKAPGSHVARRYLNEWPVFIQNLRSELMVPRLLDAHAQLGLLLVENPPSSAQEFRPTLGA